ncbi:MAG: hypothetical protein CVU57_05170 [Deltaproteobacteria bacterium HGW-Deltaproteobacteria-15]|jgi:Tfp pilus assembly PilM family ATPase|nr:MAG: hypothetical protein CVU57_05170 [Deltaproteobacteria bacterium HGW-Deltaproteobacteria-15]
MRIIQTFKDALAARSSAGVYWDESSIGMVQISGSLRSLEIERFVSAPLQEGMNPAEAVKEILSKEPLRYEKLVSAVPASQAVIRQLEVHFTDLKKLKKAIKYQVEPFIPGSAEDIVADIIAPIHDGRLLSTALDKRILSEHLRILRSAGMNPEITAVSEVSLYYLYKALYGEETPHAVCIVNVLPNRMGVQVIRNGRLELLRLIETSPSIIDHLGQTLRIWNQRNTGEEITEILVTGPLAAQVSVVEGIENATHTKARTWNPLDLVKHKLNGLSEEVGLSLCIPLGLAVMGLMPSRLVLNLQKDEFEKRKGRGLKTHVLIFTFSLVAILAISFTKIYMRLHSYEAEHDRLGKAITQVFAEAFPGSMKPLKGRELSQMKQKISEEKGQYKWAHDVLSGKLSLDSILSLSNILAGYPGISVDQITIEDKKIAFGGHTTSFSSLDKLKEALSKSPAFSNARLTGTKMDKKDNSISFQFSMETPS